MAASYLVVLIGPTSCSLMMEREWPIVWQAPKVVVARSSPRWWSTARESHWRRPLELRWPLWGEGDSHKAAQVDPLSSRASSAQLLVGHCWDGRSAAEIRRQAAARLLFRQQRRPRSSGPAQPGGASTCRRFSAALLMMVPMIQAPEEERNFFDCSTVALR